MGSDAQLTEEVLEPGTRMPLSWVVSKVVMMLVFGAQEHVFGWGTNEVSDGISDIRYLTLIHIGLLLHIHVYPGSQRLSKEVVFS